MNQIEKLENRIIKIAPKSFKSDIQNAIAYGKTAYKNKTRYNGDPMILHTLNLAIELEKLHLDTSTILASILHEVEIDEETEKYIKTHFGDTVLYIIRETKRIKDITKAQDTDPEIIIKYILNSSSDLRPIILKIVDNLQDIHTIKNIPEEDKKDTLNRALNIYSTLAEYLHFTEIKRQIDEYAFKELLPLEYQSISQKLEEMGINETLYRKYVNKLKQNTESITPKPRIEGRIKSKYSIYKKLKKYEKEWINPKIESLDDLLAFRIIVGSEDSCYKALEKLMDSSSLNYEKFDDYISNPKKNGYRAIHFPLAFPDIHSREIEVQVLTEEMHHTNTYGSASHIAYKASQSRYANPSNEYSWVKDINDRLEDCKNQSTREKDIPLKVDIFQEDIFVLTPKMKIIPLQKGDTVLDFAYKLHTAIGNSASSAKVNGQPKSLAHILQTGDVVEIKTDKNKQCQKEKALNFSNSERTKSKIKKFLTRSLKK